MADSVRDQLLSKGWGRHSSILIDSSVCDWLSPMLPESVRELCVEDNLIIISTYDCAVINHCFDAEPWVNVLIAKRIESMKKDFQNGRNERKLHFPIDVDGEDHYFEVNAASIFQFERKLLLDLTKLANYDIQEHAALSLKSWLAERFRRDVWPDAFNNSTKSAKGRLKSYYKRRNDFVSGVYLNLDTWEEKEPGEKYRIMAIIAVEDGKLRPLRAALRETEKSLANADTQALDNFLKSELKNALGDTVDWVDDPTSPPLNVAIEIKPESGITVSHLRNFRRLNPYSMSDETDGAPMPAEMEGSAQ